MLARTAVAAWRPERWKLLAGLLLLLVVCVPLLLFGLRGLERRKAAYDRLFTNPWLLTILSLLYFTALVTIPGFLRRLFTLAAWADTADYALILFTAVITIYLFVLETAVFGPTIYRIQDERW